MGHAGTSQGSPVAISDSNWLPKKFLSMALDVLRSNPEAVLSREASSPFPGMSLLPSDRGG